MIRKLTLWFLVLMIICLSTVLGYSFCITTGDLDLDYSVYNDGILKIYDFENGYIGTYNCISDEDNCYLAISQTESLLDKIVITDEVKKSLDITIPTFGYVSFIYDDEKINLVNLSTGDVIESYVSAKYLKNGYLALSDESLKYSFSYVDETSMNHITDYKFDSISSSDWSDYFLASENGEYGLYDEDANLVKTLSFETVNYNNYVYVTYENSDYYVYSIIDDEVFDDNFTMVKLDDNFIYGVKNNLLYIYDNEYNLINQEAINLGTVNNWNDYLVYDDDYNFLYQDSVFSSSYDDATLTIYVSDEEYNFEIN